MENRKYNVVTNYIKKQIKSGDLSFGDQLPPERNLSEKLKVSRATVAEGIKIMELMGIVQTKRGGGNFLVQNLEKAFYNPFSSFYSIDEDAEKQILEFRKMLEIQAIELCALNIIPKDLSELEEICNKLSTEKEGKELVKLDRKFHKKIIEGSRNKLAIGIYESISEMLEASIEKTRESFKKKYGSEMIIKDHCDMLESIKNKDSELAKSYMTKHLNHIEKSL